MFRIVKMFEGEQRETLFQSENKVESILFFQTLNKQQDNEMHLIDIDDYTGRTEILL